MNLHDYNNSKKSDRKKIVSTQKQSVTSNPQKSNTFLSLSLNENLIREGSDKNKTYKKSKITPDLQLKIKALKNNTVNI